MMMEKSDLQCKRLVRLILPASTGLMLLILSSCATSAECPPQPEWMSSPEAEGYYVGVGSADSGNPAEDRPVAESRARADLATRISVQISSDMLIETESSSSGGYEQRVEELVNQSVEKNIQDIETVDTYYCRD
ncbi:MAG: LPP20 family lipoprotein, partial [Sediminispirochaetaceae bacterium]